eukprot:4585625-Prymnesium_polylepis.1
MRKLRLGEICRDQAEANQCSRPSNSIEVVTDRNSRSDRMAARMTELVSTWYLVVCLLVAQCRSNKIPQRAQKSLFSQIMLSTLVAACVPART